MINLQIIFQKISNIYIKEDLIIAYVICYIFLSTNYTISYYHHNLTRFIIHKRRIDYSYALHSCIVT